MMRAKTTVVALALLFVACSSEGEEEKPKDAAVKPDSTLRDGSIKDKGLLSCQKACSGTSACFTSASLCEGTCNAFVSSATEKQTEACSNCVMELFKDGTCPDTYSEALVGCEPCELECAEGEDPCEQRCVDLQTENFHCGKCGTVCDQEAGFFCTAGVCSCAAGLTGCEACVEGECAPACTDTKIDHKNCGSCGKVCQPGEGCLNGACCLNPKKICNNACIDVLANNANCGKCGVACVAPQTCQSGQCLP